MTHRRHRRAATVVTALLAALAALAGCAPAPEQPPDPVAPGAEEAQAAVEGDISLDLPPSPLRGAFNGIEEALADFQWMRASVALDAIDPAGLSAEDAAYHRYLQARVSWVRGDRAGALALLNSARRATISDALRYRIATFGHFMLALSGNPVAAAREAASVLSWAPRERRDVWRRSTWLDLQRASTGQLQAALAEAAEPDWIGWLQLALDSRDAQRPLADVVRQWRARYPEHPAANPLPGGIGLELQATASRRTVALLLPLSGRLGAAGRAVLDGYLAAHYLAANSFATNPSAADQAAAGALPARQLLVLDTDAFADAASAYDSAVARGAEIVIGPLSKEAVTDLATRPARPVPVIALNRIDSTLPATGSPLVQLSLAPEDEAQRIAELAFGSGARRAMIIGPGGAWGEKVDRALRARWAELGGAVVSAATYSDPENYSASVKDALGLSESERRARRIRDMLATNIEFTARRRGDPDVVFLLSREGSEARSLKPLLAFHYAGNIPVYALSSVYNGVPDERNRDLNGINLVETPWLLGASPALRVAIAAADNGGGSYTRLNALGADAFLLQAHFTRLQAGADALLRGNTGLLSMDPQLRMRRELTLATFDAGEIRAQ